MKVGDRDLPIHRLSPFSVRHSRQPSPSGPEAVCSLLHPHLDRVEVGFPPHLAHEHRPQEGGSPGRHKRCSLPRFPKGRFVDNVKGMDRNNGIDYSEEPALCRSSGPENAD